MKKTLILFRLYDPTYSKNGNYGNKKTLSVYLNPDNTLGYSLYGDWQNSGTAFSISNLAFQRSLPMSPNSFDIESLDREIRDILKTGIGGCAIAKVEILNDLTENEIGTFDSKSFLKFVRKHKPSMVNHGEKINLFELEQLVKRFEKQI